MCRWMVGENLHVGHSGLPYLHQILHCWSASCSIGDLCCRKVSTPHIVVCWLPFLLAWRLVILTGICHDLLRYSGQILPDSFLDFICHLHGTGYLNVLILIVLNVLPVFVESKGLSYKCEKSMLSDPLMAMIPLPDFNMHNHSITQLCITYSISKHHITKKSIQVRICLYFSVWCNKYCQYKISNIFLFQVISCEIFQQFIWCLVWSQIN
jgi:hypothetical protein